MKNRMKQTLRRELKSVRVSDELKMRILAEAAGDRFRAEKKRSPMGWLAAAAAMILVVGITAGMLSLRTTQTTPRTLAHKDGGWVWVCEGDALYHARKSCGGLTGMERIELETAKAQGRTACRECITVSSTQKPAEWQSEPIEAAVIPESTTISVSTSAPAATVEIPEVEDGPTLVPTVTVAPTLEVDYDVTDQEPEAQNWSGMPTVAPLVDVSVAGASMSGDLAYNVTQAWTVYGEKAGEYYHLDENCALAKETYAQTLEEAVSAGLTNCPECIGEGTVQSVRMEAEQFGPWVRCRASMPTQVEWIPGQGSVDMDSEEAQRILSNLCPVYMSQEQADEFYILFNEGKVKGFRSTLCMLSVEDNDLWKTQTQFYANENGVRETTLLLESDKSMPSASFGLQYLIVQPEYIFEEGGVVDNTASCSVRTLRAQGEGESLDAMVLASITGESNQEAYTLSNHTSSAYSEEMLELSPTLLRLEIDDEVYLLEMDNGYACESVSEIQAVTENEKYLIADLFGVLDSQVEMGHSWTHSPEYLLYPAYRIASDTFSKGVNVETKPESYFATYGGLYYHKVRNCSGMRGATEITEDDFDVWNKKPCPVCLNSLPVWTDENGVYYHRSYLCSGQYNMLEISANEAEKNMLTPCPFCFSELTDDWIDQVVQSTVSVEARAGDGVLLAEVVPELGVEWIYAEKSEYGWSESKEVQRFLYELSPSMMTEAEAEEFRSLLEEGEVVGFRCIQYELEKMDILDKAGDIQANANLFTDDSQRRISVLAQYQEKKAPSVARMEVNCRAIVVRFANDSYVQTGRDCTLVMEEPGIARIEYGEIFDDDTGNPTLSVLTADVQPATVHCQVEALDDMNVEQISVGDARFVRVQDHFENEEDVSGRLLIEQNGMEVEPVAISCSGEDITVRLPDGMDLAPVSVRMTSIENGQVN